MRRQTPPIMLFAAGFGTRMAPLTDTRPKPLIEVGGQTLLDHTLGLAQGIAPSRLIVNTHYLADQIIGHLHGKKISISLEQSLILDTGGGLRAALPLLDGDHVITSNTDAIWRGPNPFEALLEAWNPQQMDALLLCLPLSEAVGRDAPGDFSLGKGGLLSRGGDHVFTGVQIVRTALVADHPETVFSLNAVWDEAISKGRAFGVHYTGTWCDVGQPSGIALAETLLGRCDV